MALIKYGTDGSGELARVGASGGIRCTFVGSGGSEISGWLTDAQLRASPVDVKVQSDEATFYIYTGSLACALNKYFLAFLNTGAQVIAVRKLFLINTALVAVVGVGLEFDLIRITSIAGGTAVAPATMDTNESLTGYTCVHTPSSVGESTLLFGAFTNNDEIGLTNAFPTHSIFALNNLMLEGNKVKDLRLRQNQGFAIKQITNTAVGTFAILAAVTVVS